MYLPTSWFLEDTPKKLHVNIKIIAKPIPHLNRKKKLKLYNVYGFFHCYRLDRGGHGFVRRCLLCIGFYCNCLRAPHGHHSCVKEGLQNSIEEGTGLHHRSSYSCRIVALYIINTFIDLLLNYNLVLL